MISFCPVCGSILQIYLNNYFNLDCPSCPYTYTVSSVIRTRTNCTLKEMDDIYAEGEEAWKNVDFTEQTCPECDFPRAYFMQIQTRSADEPMTTYYRCCNHNCSFKWRD